MIIQDEDDEEDGDKEECQMSFFVAASKPVSVQENTVII